MRLSQPLSLCSIHSGQHRLRAEIRITEKADFGWVEIRQLNVVVSEPKFTIFLVQHGLACS